MAVTYNAVTSEMNQQVSFYKTEMDKEKSHEKQQKFGMYL